MSYPLDLCNLNVLKGYKGHILHLQVQCGDQLL